MVFTFATCATCIHASVHLRHSKFIISLCHAIAIVEIYLYIFQVCCFTYFVGYITFVHSFGFCQFNDEIRQYLNYSCVMKLQDKHFALDRNPYHHSFFHSS